MATKIDFEVEAKSSAANIWASLTYDCITLLPKALPHVYLSFEPLEGDEISAGSTRLIKFTPGFSDMTSVTEKVESVDEANKTMCYTILGGEIMNYLNNFKSVFSVNSKDDGSCVLKFKAEFDQVSEEVDGGDLYKGFVHKVIQDLDAYFVKALFN